MADSQRLTAEFTHYAATKLADSLAQIERCLHLLTVEQIWQRPNEVSNSIGNLVLHLTGNVRQWILAGLGGEAFDRDRPTEFARREPLPAGEIGGRLRSTVEAACRVIRGLTADDLARTVSIQDYEISALAAVFHVVEHFSLHTGQIVYAAKLHLNRV